MCREVRHTPHKWSVWTDEADEPGGGSGPLLEPQPSRAQRASAGEQSAGHQHRLALPHGHRHRQQVGTWHSFVSCCGAQLGCLDFFLCIRRKLSGKSKKWRSIFNLGRSVDSKGKLNRNGSVFIRASGITGKVHLSGKVAPLSTWAGLPVRRTTHF